MKIHLSLSLFTLTLLLAGCVSTAPELSVYQRIKVPERYQYGKDHYIGMSDYERYLYAYEQAYWRCIKDRAKNIGYQFKSEDLIGNGWPPAIDGTRDGYLAGNKRVNDLVKTFGNEKTRRYLREVLGLASKEKKK